MNLPFKNIVFEESSHTYYDKTTGETFISVTTALKKFTKPFQKSFWLRKKSEDLGISIRELEKQWSDSAITGSTSGSMLHLLIENRFRNKIIEPLFNVPQDCVDDLMLKYNILKPMAEQFVDDHEHLNVVLQEGILQMGGLAGQIDMLTQNEDGTYTIWDFKTNKKLSTYSDKFLNELNHLKAWDENKFALQLSCYQRMLEEIGYVISERKIVWFCVDNDAYELITLPYLKSEAELLINYDYN